jgi:exosortase
MSLLAVSLRRHAAAAAALAAFAALYWPTFGWMAQRFDARDSFYSHGWLIPLASAWLAWQQRDGLRALAARPDYAGLVLLVLSAIVHVLATWWQVHVVSGLAMVGALAGLVWTIRGRAVALALWRPLAFLLFMVPLPGIWLIAVSFHLKMAAAALATGLLNLGGLAASQAGSTIHVPRVSVIIDDSCSGLRSLISLIALASLWAALLPGAVRGSRRALLVAASVPIALLANIARIIVLVLIAVTAGAPAAAGFMHHGSGLVVFGIAFAALAGLGRWVQGRG